MTSMVIDEGPRDALPIVLVHGVGLDLHMWDVLVPMLVDRHRVVRYDLAGHGDSEPLDEGTALSTFVEQLRSVADSAGLNTFVLVGFSLGALVAQGFALAFPRRVQAVVLVSSVFARTAAERDAVLERVADVRNGGYESSIVGALERWFTPTFAGAHAHIVEAVRLRLRHNDVASYAHAYQVFATADAELVDAVAEIAVPALVVTGFADPRSTPAMTKALAAALPQGRAVVLPGLRHLVPMEDPAALAELIDEFVANAIVPTGEPQRGIA